MHVSIGPHHVLLFLLWLVKSLAWITPAFATGRGFLPPLVADIYLSPPLSGSTWCLKGSMGNCMERRATRKPGEETEAEKGDGGVTTDQAGGCKVKILLTRKELQWLVLRLKEKREQRLEDVLVEMGREMEKGRGKAKGWKPTLESIVEIPETRDEEVV